jgi:catechol 2,3-dioxygenase-like lactoylglutathione lyase family enzyme
MKTHLRVARPTNDINALLPFYQQGLGFEIIDSFQDHDGFDGMMLGQPGGSYHLEFTRRRGHLMGRAPTPEHLLVFYFPDLDAWKIAVQRMHTCGFEPVPAFNPYWDLHGRTFEDPDGYRVVLQNAGWTNEKD